MKMMRLLIPFLFSFQLCLGKDSAVLFPRASEDPSGCVVTDGNSAGEPCVFPFIFGNNTYKECIPFSDPDQLPWCSTKVDENGAHIPGGGFWGHCSNDCPGASESPTAQEVKEEQDKVLEELEAEQKKEDPACKTEDGQDGHCQTPSLCVGSSDEAGGKQCPEAKDLNGENLILVCCTDVLDNEATQISFTPVTDSKSAITPPESVSVDVIQRIFEEEDKNNPTEATTTTPPPPATDPSVAAAPILASVDSAQEELDPEFFHLRFNQANTFALDVNDAAEDLLKVTDAVKTEKNLTDEEAGIGLRSFDLEVPIIDKRCPWTPEPKCSDKQMKFRTFDGSCNNLNTPNFGRAGTPLQRILEPSYGDSVFNSPRVSVTTFSDGVPFELPSARKVSNTMTSENNRISSEHTVLVMQMGQFIDHDITHTPAHSASCCNSDGSFPESFDTKKCFPIEIPTDDPFWKGKKTCMSFTRSLAAPTLRCSLEFQQQMNQITHWMDASQIYGSSDAENQELRESVGGLLKMSRVAGTQLGILPTCTAARSNLISMCSGCSRCFFAGDSRANEHLNLLSVHTVWVREHNRIARFLGKLNPQWDNERLFEETRKIVIAEYQHIVFKEWLPIVLGNSFMTSFGLWPLTKGYSSDYLNSFDPRITNEFSTAAFRFGHSLIPKQFDRVSPRRIRQGKSRAITAKMNMAEIFFKPQQLSSAPGILDELVAGLAIQEGNLWDNSFVPDIRDHLFESSVGSGGLDLVALNIQRGRDHGIKGYNFYRDACALGKATTWTDFQDLIPTTHIEKLSQLYSHVDDVDLFVGGFLETPDGDSILGPTFRCIIGDTFARLKLGDRFFYDLKTDESGPNFTEDQLSQIRKANMARILCDNTDNLDAIQPQPFRMQGSSASNTLQFCATSPNIPRVNLGVFKDDTKVGR